MESKEKMACKFIGLLIVSSLYAWNLSAQSTCDQYVSKLNELSNYRKQNSVDQKVLAWKATEVLQYMEPCFDQRPTSEPAKEVERLYLLGRVYYDASKLTEAAYFLKKCRDHQYSASANSGNKSYKELSASMYAATTYAQTSANRGAAGSVRYSGKGGYSKQWAATFQEDQDEPFTSREIEELAGRRIAIGSLTDVAQEEIRSRAWSDALKVREPFILVNDVNKSGKDDAVVEQRQVVIGLELDEDTEDLLDVKEEEETDGQSEGLMRLYDYLRNTYGIHAPSDYITIYLDHSAFSQEGYREFSAFAKRIHYRHAGGRVAYYNPMDQSVVCWISSGIGTLNHEVVHALVGQDYPDVPGWFNEGFGALFEETAGYDEPLDNYRLIYLKEAMDTGLFPDLRTLITAPDSKFDADKETMLYAAAGRYLMMYLQEIGELANVYQSLRSVPDASREDQLEVVLNAIGMEEYAFNPFFRGWIAGRTVPEKWVSMTEEVREYMDGL